VVKRTVHRHPQALSDVEESAVYIGHDAPEAALRFLDAVEATIRILADNSEIGTVRAFDRNDLSGLRFFPVKGFEKHLIFYLPILDGIEVFPVLHGARDLGASFSE
jgi:toxin ParE1/3/4